MLLIEVPEDLKGSFQMLTRFLECIAVVSCQSELDRPTLCRALISSAAHNGQQTALLTFQQVLDLGQFGLSPDKRRRVGRQVVKRHEGERQWVTSCGSKFNASRFPRWTDWSPGG